ncbi:MAG: hypothetical protein IJV01_00060 [Bacteroidales bacterium]|nr:hypothetical protein [Bacteroidales bacterium]
MGRGAKKRTACLAGAVLALAVAAGAQVTPQDAGQEELLLMFWNVENFFDWRDGGSGQSDRVFSSLGEKHWTRGRFYAKCNAVVKTVLLTADRFGRPPDLLGLAEVENRFVLRQLVQETLLRKWDYEIVHYDSPDRRGIDCALLYRRSRFRLLSSRACPLRDSLGAILPTRDILLAVLEPIRGGLAEPVAVLVNHHPSKVGSGSEKRRALAMGRLSQLRDSLRTAGIGRIIAVGDFNDAVTAAPGVAGPFLWSARGTEKAAPEPFPAARPARTAGTIKFQGRWEKIDGCPVLEGFRAVEYIVDAPQLSVRDNGHAGTKPWRTYSGPRYLGGVSDHYPVFYQLFNEKVE